MNQQVMLKNPDDFSLIEQVVMEGDLSRLSPEQRVTYYRKVCESSGLNPFTNPFAYIKLNGKLTLYAKKDCTEQLRKIHGVSIEDLNETLIEDIYVVTARAKDKNGRIDQAKGAVCLAGLKGEAKANAIMKAETKAKRRVTLSICGMGWTDESEIDSIPNAQPVEVDINTGEIKCNKPKITVEQANDLGLILSECDENYRKWVYNYMQKQYNTNNFSELPAELFERMKTAALKNMHQNHERQRAEAEVVCEVLND